MIEIPEPPVRKEPKESLSLDHLLRQTGGNTFRLVRMATKRSLEIADGMPALVKANPNEKVTTTALREISAGKVGFKKVKNVS